MLIHQFTQILRTTSRSITKITNMPFYAVAKGNQTGIFESWAECQAATNGAKYAKFKKFNTYSEAEEFVNMYNGVEIKSVTMQECSPLKIKDEIDDLDPDVFATDDLNDDDILLAEHTNNLETIVESFKIATAEILNRFNEVASSYKDSLLQEMVNFKQNISKKETTDTPKSKKRKRTTDAETIVSSSKQTVKHTLPIDKDGFVQVYTDGACENNGRPNCKAGLGVWFGDNHPLNIGEPVKGRATNNVGEIQACTRAVEIAHNAGVKKLCINTDSQFVINSMTTWLPNWKKRNWKLKDGGPVKNKLEFIDLDNACQLIDVKWNYVKGHAGIPGNEGADALARKGAQMYGK